MTQSTIQSIAEPVKPAALAGDLFKVRRDLDDTKEALAAYWSRGITDTDYKVADVHMAAEALMRAVASLTLAVERLSETRP